MSNTDTITRETGSGPDRHERSRPITFSHRVEYLGFLALRGLIRALPFKTASNLSATLWQWIAPRLHRHERALKHLRMAMPDKSEQERASIAQAMWGHLGRTMAESFLIDRIANDPAMIEFALSDDVRQLLDAKRPIVFVSLHLGNWELVGLGATRHGVELAGVYQRIVNPLIDKSVTDLRAQYYQAGLFSKGHNTVKNLMALLRQGKSVGIISDLRDKRGVAVPFFNHPASSSPFPAIMSVMYDAPIVAAQSIRIAPDRFRMEAELVTTPDGASRDETIYNRTAAIHATFERWIRQNPEQWMWAHRRWD